MIPLTMFLIARGRCQISTIMTTFDAEDDIHPATNVSSADT